MRGSNIAAFTLLALVATNPVAHAEDPFGESADIDNSFGTAPAAEEAEAAPRRVWVDADSEATERVLAVLDSPLNSAGLEFMQTPLQEVVAFLRDEYSIEILLDQQSLNDLGMSGEEEVEVSMRDVKLRVALSAMLKPLELTYVAADGYLLITSEEEALTRLQIALYDVADLVRDGGHATYDSLIRTITSTIGRDTWSGNGTADILPFPERGVLVISQTSEAHEQISGLLSALSERPAQALTTKAPSRGGYGGMEMGGGGFGEGMGREMGMMGGRFGGEGMGRGSRGGGRSAGRRGVQERE